MAASGGTRRDSSMATQRRLHVVRVLLRGPATADALIAALQAALGDDIYPTAARTALRHDLSALGDTFGCEFVFRAADGYFLTSLGTLTLLDLAEDELAALALVAAAIRAGALPQTQPLLRLQERLHTLLPPVQRVQLAASDPGLRLDLPVARGSSVGRLITRLHPALGKREVSFQYRSPYTSAETLESHRVAPYALVQRDGMTYLEAHCLEASLPKLHGRTIFYRLDRIVANSLRRLPQQLPPVRHARRNYQLRYWVGPQAARRQDLLLWFDGSTCSYADDGSALVEACISDLWQARQVLLRYREHCRVLEPPELVDMMRESIAALAAVYAPEAGGEL